MEKCLILANGQAPNKNTFKYLAKIGYDTLICADGGANTAYKRGLSPNYIIGDFDSAKEEVLDHFRPEAEIIHYTRQNDTDVEKCLKFAVKLKYEEAILLGATGDRLDHTFCNLQIVMKFREKINVHILHQKSFLTVLNEGENGVNTIPGETISIYGIDEKTKITASGLKYPLKNTALPFAVMESTSNQALSNFIKLNVKNGKMFLIREFKVLKDNGLIYSG